MLKLKIGGNDPYRNWKNCVVNCVESAESNRNILYNLKNRRERPGPVWKIVLITPEWPYVGKFGGVKTTFYVVVRAEVVPQALVMFCC